VLFRSVWLSALEPQNPKSIVSSGGGGGGSGDVTAGANITDHSVVRGDGGVKGIQGSGVIIDDTGNVTGMLTLTLPNAGLKLLDTDASHSLIFKPGSNLTADRILTITTGDAARTITLSGNPTLDDWFNQAVKSISSPNFVAITASGLITGNALTLTNDQAAKWGGNGAQIIGSDVGRYLKFRTAQIDRFWITDSGPVVKSASGAAFPLIFEDDDASNTASLKAPAALGSNVVATMPPVTGTLVVGTAIADGNLAQGDGAGGVEDSNVQATNVVTKTGGKDRKSVV